MSGEVTPGLRELLGKQVCFQVEHWGPSSERPDMGDREQGDLAIAHVVSSAVQEYWNVKVPCRPGGAFDELFGPEYEESKHIVILDIDHAAHLVESSTPGHHHLYVEIPPVGWDDYVEFLQAAEKIGLIEPGYVSASIERGHSDVRLPWIRKNEEGDFLPGKGGIVDQVAKPVEPTCTIASPLECHQPAPDPADRTAGGNCPRCGLHPTSIEIPSLKCKHPCHHSGGIPKPQQQPVDPFARSEPF